MPLFVVQKSVHVRLKSLKNRKKTVETSFSCRSCRYKSSPTGIIGRKCPPDGLCAKCQKNRSCAPPNRLSSICSKKPQNSCFSKKFAQHSFLKKSTFFLIPSNFDVFQPSISGGKTQKSPKKFSGSKWHPRPKMHLFSGKNPKSSQKIDHQKISKKVPKTSFLNSSPTSISGGLLRLRKTVRN